MSPEREARLTAAKSRLALAVKAEADADNLSPVEALALLAFMTGSALALQDQRTITVDAAMKVVARNIEAGNRATIAQLATAEGGAA